MCTGSRQGSDLLQLSCSAIDKSCDIPVPATSHLISSCSPGYHLPVLLQECAFWGTIFIALKEHYKITYLCKRVLCPSCIKQGISFFFFPCRYVLIDNVLITDFYCDHIYVGQAKNFPPFGKKGDKKQCVCVCVCMYICIYMCVYVYTCVCLCMFSPLEMAGIIYSKHINY